MLAEASHSYWRSGSRKLVAHDAWLSAFSLRYALVEWFHADNSKESYAMVSEAVILATIRIYRHNSGLITDITWIDYYILFLSNGQCYRKKHLPLSPQTFRNR